MLVGFRLQAALAIGSKGSVAVVRAIAVRAEVDDARCVQAFPPYLAPWLRFDVADFKHVAQLGFDSEVLVA